MSRLLTQVAPLALLLLFAASAQAATFYVDLDGGSDTAFDGSTPTVTGFGNAGPFQTINRALQAAGTNAAGVADTIVILASTYSESFTVTETNLTLTAFAEGGDDVVRLTGNVTIGAGTTAASAILAAGTNPATPGTAGRFVLNTPTLTLQSGTLSFGTGITTIGDGVEVSIVRTNGTSTGTPIFASTPNVTYNGNASATAGSELRTTFVGTAVNADPTLTVALTGATAAAPRTLTIPATVDFGTGAVVNVAANNIITGTQTVSGAVTFNGPGRFGNISVVSGGTLSVASNISASGLTLTGTGIVNAGANTITLFGNFAQSGGLTTFQAGSLAFDGTGSYTFTPLGGFNVTNLAIGVGADTNPTVTFGGDATILAGGAFRVETGATAALGGNLVNIQAAGTSTVNGTVSNGVVSFQGAGSSVAGTGTYDSIFVLGGDVALAATTTPGAATTVPSNFNFTGQILLANGALNTGGVAGSDISPVGPTARVFVNVTSNGGNNKINGTQFNGDNAAFDLTYDGAAGAVAAFTAGQEFDAEYIRNLAATANGVINASAFGISGPVGGNDTIDGTVTLTARTPSTAATTALEVRFPSYNVDIAGALTVNDDVLLTVAPTVGAPAATNLTGDLTLLSATNTVIGTIGGNGRLVLGSGVAGSAVGITGVGAAATASASSALTTAAGILVASNATATISGIELVGTQIRDGNTSSNLSLGLAREIPLTGAPAGAGNVTGSVLLNGGLTLTSDVEFQNALTLNGAVAIGTNDVVFNDTQLTLNSQTVTGTTGEFQFVNGASVFNPRGTATAGNIAGATVPGINVIAPTRLTSRVTVSNTFRIASTFDANTDDGATAATDNFLTLAVNGTIVLADNAVVVGDTDPARQEVVLAGAFNFTNEQTTVFSPFAVTLFSSPQMITFTSRAGAGNLQSLPEVGVAFGGATTALTQQTFMLQNFVQESGTFNLAGHIVEAMQNVTFVGTAPIVNLQDQTVANENAATTPSGNVVRGTGLNPYSEFRLTGAANGTMTLAGLGGAPGAYIGAGVDLVLNKATETATVTLAGDGALLFDDQFTPAGVPAAFVLDTPNDETFVLARGIFAMPAATTVDRAKFYVNLDHENTVDGRTNEATTDNGQGFAFRTPSTSTVPMAQIAGTIQKRIVSSQTSTSSGSTPGRVVNPLGDLQGEYAEFTLDFESLQGDQDFGRRDIRTTFLAQSPGGSLGLPIQDGVSPGVAVGSTGNFQWLVVSNPTLGAGTRFNVEARYDGYTLNANQAIADLRLVRRQFGDETQNPFTLVSNTYDNFLIDPTPANTSTRDEEPTVVALNAQALLGPQGTLFSFGLRAVTPTNVASFQVINNAASGAPVDVYVGTTLIANNLAYGQATSYQTVTGVGATPTNLTVTVASETSTSPTGGRAFTATASQGATYAIVVFDDGVDATTNPYDAVIVNTQRTTSGSSDTVELLAINGSRDAGQVDIGLRGAASPFFRDLQFGEAGISFQTGLDAALLRVDVSAQGTGTPFYTGNLDLSPARGERGLLIAQGLRTTVAGQASRAFRLVFVRPDGSIIVADRNTVATTGPANVPTEFALRGTAPNPFRTTTNVRFDLPEAAEVQVEVYDALGRRVMQTSPSTMAPGADHGIEVNGNGLAAGLYVYRLTARGESQSWSQTGQITVLR